MSNEWIKNTKTGTVGTVVSRYINMSNGKPMVEVAILGVLAKSQRAYWLASSTEAFDA